METSVEDINYHFAVRRLLDSAHRNGLDCAKLLASVDLAADGLKNSHRQVDGAIFVTLLQRLSHSLKDEFCGLSARPVKIGCLSMMVEFCLHAQNLQVAMDNAVRFISVISDDLDFSLCALSDEAVIKVENFAQENDPENFLSDYLLFFIHRLCSWLIGYFIPIKTVFFNPKGASVEGRFVELLDHEWQPSKTCSSFSFDKKYLSMPVVKNAVEWQQHLSNLRGGLFLWPNPHDGIVSDVRRLLAANLREQCVIPNLSNVASTLAVSPQTLRRRLHLEGTNFRCVVDDLRRDLAIEALSLKGQCVEDVSLRLGFSESRSFSRAFKRWTGLSPSQYLRRYIE